MDIEGCVIGNVVSIEDLLFKWKKEKLWGEENSIWEIENFTAGLF